MAFIKTESLNVHYGKHCISYLEDCIIELADHAVFEYDHTYTLTYCNKYKYMLACMVYKLILIVKKCNKLYKRCFKK